MMHTIGVFMLPGVVNVVIFVQESMLRAAGEIHSQYGMHVILRTTFTQHTFTDTVSPYVQHGMICRYIFSIAHKVVLIPLRGSWLTHPDGVKHHLQRERDYSALPSQQV